LKILWTLALATAVDALARDFQPQEESRTALADDIRERAREMRATDIGATIQPHQIGFVNCLRSRLADPYVRFTAAEDFERAWGEAYRAAEAREQQEEVAAHAETQAWESGDPFSDPSEP